ncbi:MAG: hypothetical protein P3A28_08830 [Gemmatimonadota bacterium]|nr:hypothetical protein [Gemmatimonadota bacterium]
MTRAHRAALALAGAVALAGPARSQTAAPESRPLAGLLRDVTSLTYASDGTLQAPWRVRHDGVLRREIAGTSYCVRIVMQRAATASPADSSRLCVAGDTVFTAEPDGAVRATRPIGPGTSLIVPTRAKGTAHYQTLTASTDTIGGMPIPVVLTTATTRDSLGRVVQRLTERYAPGLATATRGEFSVPDSTVPGGWRQRQVFELKRIERRR